MEQIQSYIFPGFFQNFWFRVMSKEHFWKIFPAEFHDYLLKKKWFWKSGHDSIMYYSIMYFGNIFQEFSCVTTQFLKIALEIFSRKPPDSPPGFFDAINFKFKYLKKLTYEVGCDIMSKCTNPSPIDATWLIPIIVHGDVKRE